MTKTKDKQIRNLLTKARELGITYPLPPTSQIEMIIQSIRDSFIGAEHVYKNGSCWHFANILKTIFPQGKIYCSIDHCIFFYKDKYYDIEGHVNPLKYHNLEEQKELPRTEKFNLFNKNL